MGDKQETIQTLIEEMRAIRIADSKTPFPYEGCRRIFKKTGKRYEDLVPDLNTYFMHIFGYSSWDYKIPKWTEEKLKECEKWMRRSFFEMYPKYEPLQKFISEQDVPDLYSAFQIHERLREILLKLCALLSKT